jgi:hypothetical protein
MENEILYAKGNRKHPPSYTHRDGECQVLRHGSYFTSQATLAAQNGENSHVHVVML